MREVQSRLLVPSLLRHARKELGLRQAELASRLGVPQSFISKYESGERTLDFLEVQAICTAIGLPFAEFVMRVELQQGATDAGSSRVQE